MKKVFSLALILVAFFGIAQVATAPAYAHTYCEECCYEWYEECLITVGQPQMCENVLNLCLNDCP